MIAGLAHRLHGLVRDVEAYSLRSGQERVIGYLLAELPESAASGPAEIHLTPGKSVLASRLNMTPSTFRASCTARRERAHRGERALDPRS